jgi:hypothetical protein
MRSSYFSVLSTVFSTVSSALPSSRAENFQVLLGVEDPGPPRTEEAGVEPGRVELEPHVSAWASGRALVPIRGWDVEVKSSPTRVGLSELPLVVGRMSWVSGLDLLDPRH